MLSRFRICKQDLCAKRDKLGAFCSEFVIQLSLAVLRVFSFIIKLKPQKCFCDERLFTVQNVSNKSFGKKPVLSETFLAVKRCSSQNTSVGFSFIMRVNIIVSFQIINL